MDLTINIPLHLKKIHSKDVPQIIKSDISIDYDGITYNYDDLYDIIRKTNIGWNYNENTIIFNVQRVDENILKSYYREYLNKFGERIEPKGNYMFSLHFITDSYGNDYTCPIDIYTSHIEFAKNMTDEYMNEILNLAIGTNNN